MTLIQITTPGRNTDVLGTADIVAWWRMEDGSPQIIELDSRCVRLVPLTRSRQRTVNTVQSG